MTLLDRFITACKAIGFRAVRMGNTRCVMVAVGDREHIFEFGEGGKIIAKEILYDCAAPFIHRDYSDHPSPLKAIFSLLCEADLYRIEHAMLDGTDYDKIGPDEPDDVRDSS